MITTNVRMTDEDMMNAREMAREMGMSFNGYVNWLMREASTVIPLGGKVSDIGKTKRLDLRNLAKEARKIKNKPMGANEDDKIIYGIED